MKIVLLEPFLGGSHRAWAEGWQRHSRHEITILGLPGRHWKWRMHGGAVTLARLFREADLRPDLLLATDMLDLGVFLGLTRDLTASVPTALYFHENQLAYPWSPTDADPSLQRDNHYCFINFTSALAADHLLFNSPYNRDSFLGALPAFLRSFPDHRETGQIAALTAKSQVLPLGMDLRRLDHVPDPLPRSGPPVLLWNHRWEYDKAPGLFFESLFTLADEGFEFRLVVLGERYGGAPEIFGVARERLSARIDHWGYAPGQEEYARLLKAADILPVSSRQDFFGGSVVEAMYCGCRPLLPRRLAYPMHVPEVHAEAVFYESDADFLPRMRALLRAPGPTLPVRDWVRGYDWAEMGAVYDGVVEGLVDGEGMG